MADLSPAAQAVLDAYRSTHLSINNLAAALRAASVAPPKVDLPLSKVLEWEQIEGVCASFCVAAEWGYRQALADINTIATELEGHD